MRTSVLHWAKNRKPARRDAAWRGRTASVFFTISKKGCIFQGQTAYDSSRFSEPTTSFLLQDDGPED